MNEELIVLSKAKKLVLMDEEGNELITIRALPLTKGLNLDITAPATFYLNHRFYEHTPTITVFTSKKGI